jgi:hypothetical protein
MLHETKFLVPLEKANGILAWAREQLEPDPHGHGRYSDEYLVQGVYFDTPEFHVFRKIGSYGRAKFRVRRYGNADWLFLERKMKRGGIVRKRRSSIDLPALPEIKVLPEASWYYRRLEHRKLAPTCYIQYARVARQKMTSEGLFRFTVDQSLRYDTEVASTWPVTDGTPFLTEFAIVELKYLHMPAIAKQVIEKFNLNPGPASKYRMALRASKHAPHLETLVTEDEDADALEAAKAKLRVA